MAHGVVDIVVVMNKNFPAVSTDLVVASATDDTNIRFKMKSSYTLYNKLILLTLFSCNINLLAQFNFESNVIGNVSASVLFLYNWVY